MAARFAIKGVRKSYSHALFHACGGCSAPRCLYKVTKNSRQLQTMRKKIERISDTLCRILGAKIGYDTFFITKNVKISAKFFGHSRTYLDIAGQIANS